MAIDLQKFLVEFQDHLAPVLDTYEQAIYLYIFRHTRFVGKHEETIAFKAARARLACGMGTRGTPMSEGTASAKLRSLEQKKCIKIISSDRLGRRIRLYLPHEIDGVVPETVTSPPRSLESLDFFAVPELRSAILNREGHRCFYCLRKITQANHVIEHVVSRPDGDSSYRNVVAACRQCNNRKSNSTAEDFLRTLYRDQLLSQTDFDDRVSHLQRLRKGELKPPMINSTNPPPPTSPAHTSRSHS